MGEQTLILSAHLGKQLADEVMQEPAEVPTHSPLKTTKGLQLTACPSTGLCQLLVPVTHTPAAYPPRNQRNKV